MKTDVSLLILAPLQAAARPTILVEEQAVEKRGTCFPVNVNFQVSVPYVQDASFAPSLNYGGYQWQLPQAALTGDLISFFGNFFGNETTSSQVTTITNSTSVAGGPSMSNGTASANGTTIVTATFASGNASSLLTLTLLYGAAGGAVGNNTGSSTSSEGNANSTATATANANGVVVINTNATVANASDAQSIQNERAAAAATSCAADNNGASAEAEEITTVNLEVDQDGIQRNVTSVAYAACSAGVDAPSAGGSSSSGSEASITHVSAEVTCSGGVASKSTDETIFRIAVKGSYCRRSGFAGAVTGQRIAESEASC